LQIKVIMQKERHTLNSSCQNRIVIGLGTCIGWEEKPQSQTPLQRTSSPVKCTLSATTFLVNTSALYKLCTTAARQPSDSLMFC
jgi:hypothetical protein